jgi:uncharacterized protein YjbI with pentapeptide repeats
MRVTARNLSEIDLGDVVHKYCEFSDIANDDFWMSMESDFIDCSFENIQWYGALFNCQTIIGCAFTNCTFQGVTFASCRLVDCEFNTCKFMPDNLGGDCHFDDNKVYGCYQVGCIGLSRKLIPLGIERKLP